MTSAHVEEVIRSGRAAVDESQAAQNGHSLVHDVTVEPERGTFDERFRSRRVDLFERLEHGTPEINYLPASHRMLVRGKRHLLPAPKKTGKSLGMLVHWIDMILDGATVTILDRENGGDLYAARLGLIMSSRGLDGEQRATLAQGLGYYEFPKLRDYDRADLVEELKGADLVVFDGQRRFLSDLGLDENDSDDYTAFMEAAIDPLFEAGIATLILDNTGHETAGRPRGSSAKEDLNEITFTLETVEPYSEKRIGKLRLRLEAGRSRFGNEGTWEMTIGQGVFGGWDPIATDDIVATEHQDQRDEIHNWIVTHVLKHPGATKTATVQACRDALKSASRKVANSVFDQLLTGSDSRVSHGTGKAANAKALYPASQQSFPLPAHPTGTTGTTGDGSHCEESFPSFPPPYRAGSREAPSESDGVAG
jgi:hypothetical protein